MKHLEIDFAPPSLYRSLAQIKPVCWLALLASLVWALAIMLQHLQIIQNKDAQQARIQLNQAKLTEQANFKPPELKTTVTLTKAKAVNQAIAKLNLPWHDLFDALEAATPANIALLGLDPDPRQRILRVAAEAKDSQEMAQYLRKLRAADFFDSIVLTRHEINEQDPNRPLRFQFEARWLVGFDMPLETAEDRLEAARAKAAEQVGGMRE